MSILWVFVSLLVKIETGDTLFHSGKMDGDYQLIQEDIPFEKHHDIINDEVMSAGTHEMDFDVSDLQEGIYILKIHTGSDIMSRKLVVVR